MSNLRRRGKRHLAARRLYQDHIQPSLYKASAVSGKALSSLQRNLERWQLGGQKVVAAQTPQAESTGLDLLLAFAIFALLGLGVVLVYSSSAVYADEKYGSSAYFLMRNLAYLSLGLIAMFVGWRIDYRFYRRLVYPLLIGTILMLAAVLLLGTRVEGATRWFRLGGLSFQPSEPAKFALVVYLAHSLTNKRDSMKKFSIGFLPHILVIGLICGLVVKEPDLGTTAVLGCVAFLLLFIAGTKLSYILLSFLVAAPIVYQLIVGTPWRMRRVLAFLDPWAYRHDAGYQISESLISVGSGGFTGLGLGDGRQKLFFLPAAHTDFIFAIIGEELGLIGMAAVIALFLLLVWRGVRAALKARDLFGTYVATGITATFGLQAVIHMSVVLGLVPTKGITLPFVSYGGSAMVTTLFCAGVLLNIAARHPEPVARRNEEKRRVTKSNRRRLSRVEVADERSLLDEEVQAPT